MHLLLHLRPPLLYLLLYLRPSLLYLLFYLLSPLLYLFFRSLLYTLLHFTSACRSVERQDQNGCEEDGDSTFHAFPSLNMGLLPEPPSLLPNRFW